MNRERRMDEQSAKEAVKEVHPAAFLSAKGTVWSERGMTKIRLGKSWIDAASRLAPTKQPEPASDEFPKASRCGHCGLILDGSLRRCSNGGWCSEEGQPSPEPKVEPELQQEDYLPPLPSQRFDYDDDQVLAAVQDTEYAKNHIRAKLMHMTGNEKASLYRAIASLSQPSPAPATPPPTEQQEMPKPLVSDEWIDRIIAECPGEWNTAKAAKELQWHRKNAAKGGR